MLDVKSENLRIYLKKNRGEQARLARELGIGTSNISQWLNGTRPIPAEVVPLIEGFFGIDLNDSAPVHGIVYTEERDRKEQLLAAVAHKLSDKQLAEVLSRALLLEQSES